MKIAIDAREAFGKSPTGKGLWAREVIEELQRRGIKVLLLGGQGKRNVTWHVATAWGLFRNHPADLYLSPTSYLIPWMIGERFPCAVVVHDLIAFAHEAHDRKARIIEQLTLPKVLKTSKCLFTVSEATKRDLLERFPKTDQRKITVVYEGSTIEKATNYKLQTTNFPYILSIGTLCPRKNQLRLIQAYNALPETTRRHVKLTLLGSRGWHDGEIVALAKNSPNIEWRGYVPDEERDALLAGATVFAYPSLHEGFGLPVLDALTLGIPTLTSNCSSLPEVAGDAAVFVNPESKEEIREGLLRLLLDETLRHTLKERGPKQAAKFSWERTVDRMLTALINPDTSA